MATAARPTAAERDDPCPSPPPSPRRVAVALVLLVLAVLGPWVPRFTAQTSPRWAFAGAVVDDGTTRLDDYTAIFAADDYAEVDGHVHLDKAPGQPVLAVPLYASARAVGAEPARELRVDENLGAWWITLWTAVVPTAALCALMYLAARRTSPETAVAAALGLTFGTILPVVSTTMYGHSLSALLGFSAWLVARRAAGRDRSAGADPAPLRPGLLAGAGALAGAAVCVEYTLAFVALALAGWLLWAGAGRRLGWYVVGGLPFALALAAYNVATFGSPLASAYSSKPAFEQTPTVVGLPDPGTGLAALVGSRGLFVLTPVVLVAVGGAVLLWRERRHRDQVVVAGVVLVGLWLVHAGWPNPWGGEVPGPRYLVPALPFLAVPLARAWQRVPLAALAAAVVGAVVMGLGVLTEHLVGHGAQVVPTYLENLRVQGLNPTVLTMGLGPAGWLVHLALVAGAVLWLRRCLSPPRAAPAAAP